MKNENEILKLVKEKGWLNIIKTEELTENILKKYSKYFDFYCWNEISKNYVLSEEFIEEFKDKLNWNLITKYKKVSENIIKKYIEYFNDSCIDNISCWGNLSESFIEKFKDKLNWDLLILHQNISENLLKKSIKYLNPYLHRYISETYILSNEFIEEFKDKLNLTLVYLNQKLNPEFILKHKDKLSNWEDLIIQNKKISEETIIKLWKHLKYYTRNKYLNKLNQIEKMIFLSKVKKEKRNENGK